MLSQALYLAAILAVGQDTAPIAELPPVAELSNPISALDALRLCQLVTADFTAARASLESEGWKHRPPSKSIAEHWGAQTAGWYKKGFPLIAFNAEHGTEDEHGNRPGHCLAEFRGDSNIAATEVAAATGISASSYARTGKNTLHNFQFDLKEVTVFISNRADRENPDQILGIVTLAVEPKLTSLAE